MRLNYLLKCLIGWYPSFIVGRSILKISIKVLISYLCYRLNKSNIFSWWVWSEYLTFELEKELKKERSDYAENEIVY